MGATRACSRAHLITLRVALDALDSSRERVEPPLLRTASLAIHPNSGAYEKHARAGAPLAISLVLFGNRHASAILGIW